MAADPNEQQHGQTLFSQRARYHSSENNFEFSWPTAVSYTHLTLPTTPYV